MLTRSRTAAPVTRDLNDPNVLVIGEAPKSIRAARVAGLVLANLGALLGYIYLKKALSAPDPNWIVIVLFAIVALLVIIGALILILSPTHRAIFDRRDQSLTIEQSGATGQMTFVGSLSDIDHVGIARVIGLGGRTVIQPSLVMRNGPSIRLTSTAKSQSDVERLACSIAAFIGLNFQGTP
jgi:hypothetical protein